MDDKKIPNVFLKVFIQTPEENSKYSNIGKWLILPANVDKLSNLLVRIGADGGQEPPFEISSIKTPFTGVRGALFLSDRLDELNMIAHYLKGMEDFELDSLQAILQSGVMAEGRGAAALLNLMDADNIAAFNVIDASNAEELGRYWLREAPDAIPEEMTPEEYGRECVSEEKGTFTEWGYVYRRMELSQQYDGVVPDEYRITDAALRSVQPEPPYVDGCNIKLSCVSRFEGMTALLGMDDKVYLGKTENYSSGGHYDNSDRSLIYVSNNRNVHAFLYGDGPLYNQAEALTYHYTMEDYAEFARLQNGLLSEFEKIRDFTFDRIPFMPPDSKALNNQIAALERAGGAKPYWERMMEKYHERWPNEPDKRPSAAAKLEAAKRAVKPPAPRGSRKKKDIEME